MNKNLLSLSALLLSLTVLPVRADVTLPKLIGDHMVLQQEKPLPIWGWADSGEEVTVQFDDAHATAKTDAQGRWQVTLPAMKADGKAHHMSVSGKNKIEINDILIGEVWIGSGQSNMEFTVSGSTTAKEAISAANKPQIRLLHVKKVQSATPAKDIVVHSDAKAAKNAPPPPPETGQAWKVCKPETVPSFAAVLYYFGERLQKDLNIPIGLIDSSWGGSPIEAWLPKTGGMYNAMIAPLEPFAIRGVLWYQGETNVLKPDTSAYFDKQKSLIEGWRQGFGQEFAFYEVQIAPWDGRYEAGRLPVLWECQVETLKLPHTGMAVTTDLVDNLKDIHPKDKIDVGNRLALWALAKDYKKDVVYSGPLYKSMKIDGNKIRLTFAHTGGGLKSRDGKPLSEFEIAGQDGKFVPATATIDGNSIVVESKDVASPTQVRFGWRNTANPNLINAEGLPASPFQTNNWLGGTGE